MGFRDLKARLLPLMARLAGRRLSIGARTRIASTARIHPGDGEIVIGKSCEIQTGALIYAYDGYVRIGDNVSVQPYSILFGGGGLTIGNDVRIACHVTIIPANHRFEDRDRPIRTQGMVPGPIVIEDDVWIGAGVRVTAGVRIARGCVIAANAVVTRDTEPFGVYGGVPARRIKER
ncbi:MAG: acyltransferase [Siculibacillus sp.]